jgi:hypothetical protein
MDYPSIKMNKNCKTEKPKRALCGGESGLPLHAVRACVVALGRLSVRTGPGRWWGDRSGDGCPILPCRRCLALAGPGCHCHCQRASGTGTCYSACMRPTSHSALGLLVCCALVSSDSESSPRPISSHLWTECVSRDL